MRRYYNYVFPIIICAAFIAAVLCGYFLYEAGGNMDNGVAFPIVLCCGFALCYAAEIVAVRFKKYNLAIGICIFKYVFAVILTVQTFQGTIAGILFFAIIGLAIPVLGPLIFVAMALRAVFAIVIFTLHIGVIAEPILLSMEKSFYNKSLLKPNDNLD